MIPLSVLKNNSYYVVGLARSGIAAVRALKKAGATVYSFDDSTPSDGTKPEDINWKKVDALVLSPGIPHTFPKPHKSAELARLNAVPIVCDVDLLAQSCPDAKFVSITGTNGKSTTTALLNHLLPNAQMGGNIGSPVLDLEVSPSLYILELSSYQLERVPHLKSQIAVWLNVTPDHIDRHGDFQGYISAKKNIFAPVGVKQTVLIGIDDKESFSVYKDLKKDPAKIVIPISTTEILKKGLSAVEGILYDNALEICDLDIPTLKGSHNHQNIAAAYGVIKSLGEAFDPKCVKSFLGLPHRQEIVSHQDMVLFVNDSKATNITSTLKALSCYESVHLLLGGVPKEAGLEGLIDYKSSIAHAYVFGQAADEFSVYLKKANIDHSCFETLEEATLCAAKKAQDGKGHATVLLSPACSSFDQFKNFEERGKAFKSLVKEITSSEDSHV